MKPHSSIDWLASNRIGSFFWVGEMWQSRSWCVQSAMALRFLGKFTVIHLEWKKRKSKYLRRDRFSRSHNFERTCFALMCELECTFTCKLRLVQLNSFQFQGTDSIRIEFWWQTLEEIVLMLIYSIKRNQKRTTSDDLCLFLIQGYSTFATWIGRCTAISYSRKVKRMWIWKSCAFTWQTRILNTVSQSAYALLKS